MNGIEIESSLSLMVRHRLFLPLDREAGRALVTDRILFPFLKCETSFSATGWGHIAGAIGHNCMQMPFLPFPYLNCSWVWSFSGSSWAMSQS